MRTRVERMIAEARRKGAISQVQPLSPRAEARFYEEAHRALAEEAQAKKASHHAT